MSSSSYVSYINSIEFCVFGNETYDNKEPKQGGIIDTRLGVTDNNQLCKTCKMKPAECPGHFGHTELSEEVFHAGHLDLIKNIANCICLHCSKPLINDMDKTNELIKNTHGKNRFAKMKKITSNAKFCQYPDNNCGKPVAKVSKDISKKNGSINLIATYYTNTKQDESINNISKKDKNVDIISPSRLYKIFSNIDDDDIILLGFDPKKNRPENFIIKIFPISPVSIRPSVRLESLSSMPSEDGLTGKISDIIKANNKLKKHKEKAISNEDLKYTYDNLQLLQYEIATFFDKQSVYHMADQKSSKVVKSISERLVSKHGRIRGNLMGKRVDYSARTVITSDPNLEIDELGVPLKIAMKITIPELVTSFNIDRLKKYVKNGKNTYPGANFVIPYNPNNTNSSKIDLNYVSVNLNYFDIVERHLIDGDYVLFNRQPSLHKMSMMCHKIKVIPNNNLNTFRINVTVTTPYNADFDGDEMNIFIPQTIQTELEIKHIAAVKNQIISPKTSLPIIKFVQDSVLGSYLITLRNDNIDYHDAMNLLLYCNTIDIFNIDKQNITGRDLFSKLIPSFINYKDNNIEISNSKILSGFINKKIINDKIVFFSWDKHGEDITADFYNNTQKFIINWLLINGFTVGIKDAIIKKEYLDDIKSIIEIKVMEIDNIITEMENNPDTLDTDIFEKKIFTNLNASGNDIITKLNKYMLSENVYNNFFIMVNSGAKGSPLTLSQIIGGLGQKSLDFKRISKKVNNRTLPHFFQNDDRPQARGYISSSYYSGLNPLEFFFEHQTAREGMIDTAIKSVTGDTNIIILEDNIIKYTSIGEWIDNKLELFKDSIKFIEDDKEMELLELNDKVFIPTTDNNGFISWGEITHITRHNPGKELYKITSYSGREVIVTMAHSLLIWDDDNDKLIEKSALDVNIGDEVPITYNLVEPPIMYEKLNIIESIKIGLYISNNNQNGIENKDYKYKYILPEYFGCSNTIIQGIINGIFSAGCIIDSNSIQYKSSNKRLLEDINICLSRLGIYGRIDDDILYIEDIFIYKFRSLITLINENKNNKLLLIIPKSKYKMVNDIILDKIIKIEKIDIDKYPKVYDLTIPTTYNFGISNGLHVVDTSDSGYLQRKLVKGMEDIMMAYDKTIRSSNNIVIQLLYGDNNINQTHYKNIDINLVKMSDSDINNKFIFNSNEQKIIIKDFNLDKSKFNEWNENLYKILISMRDELRNIQMISKMNYIVLINNFKLPVNIKRIIEDTINNKPKKNTKLNPLYIIQSINYILDPNITRINLTPKDYDINSFKFKDQQRAKTIFKIALYEYLNPKKCIIDYNISKEQFDSIILDIIYSFKKAGVEPGEMLGVMTAQTLGEILTQMSQPFESNLLLLIRSKNGENKKIIKKIGDFVEELYEQYPKNILNIPIHNDSTEFDMSILEDEYYICGVDNEEKVKWNKISHLSRHPTNGNLMEVVTYSDRRVTSTMSHNFLKRTKENKIEPIRGDQLKLGDRIPVARKIDFVIYNKILNIDGYELNLSENMGWLFGAYLAEGHLIKNGIFITNISPEYYNNIYTLKNILNINIMTRKYQGEYGPGLTNIFTHKDLANLIRNHFKCGSFNKVVPEFVHNTNLEFIKGLLRGYMDGDGNISAIRKIIRVGSRSKQLIEDIALLFTYFGIFGSHYVEKKKNNKTPFYCLGIPHKYARMYLEKIGTDIKSKEEDILKIIEFSETYHNGNKEFLDMIPELGHIINRVTKILEYPGQSRSFGVLERKNLSIGRTTLIRYIQMFKKRGLELDKYDLIKSDLEYLEMISNGDVIWDKIKEINIIEDPKEYVYDLTVPGNETFMNYNGIIVHNTLNSVAWDEKILHTMNNDTKCNVVNIGEMIDKMLEENKQNIIYQDESEYLDIKDRGYKIQSVDENGKMHWKLIEAITRHPPYGNVIKVITLNGREVVATKSKSFLLRKNNKLVEVNGSELKIGDMIPVQKNAPKLNFINEYNNIVLDDIIGYFIGNYMSYGKIEHNIIILLKDELNILFLKNSNIEYSLDDIHIYINHNNEHIIKIMKIIEELDKWIYISNDIFVKNFLLGFFHNKHYKISNSKILLINIMQLLTRCNINSRILYVDDNYILTLNIKEDIIPSVNIDNIYGDIDRNILENLSKNNFKLNLLLYDTLNEDVYYDKIIDIIDLPLENFTPGHDKVYDLTVQDTKNFNILNGMCMRDTFHQSGVGVIGMQGIPRFREILSYTKNIQTPGMIVKLIPEIKKEERLAHKIEAYLKYTVFSKMIENLEIIYDPLADNISKKDGINDNIFYINNNIVNITNLPWLYRLTISRQEMLENDISLLDIKTKFIKFFEDYLDDANKKKMIISRIVNGCIISNFDNSKIPYIHIRLNVLNPDNQTLIEISNFILNKIPIKGISTIKNVELVQKQKVIEYNEDNSVNNVAYEWVLYLNGIDLNKLKSIKYIDFNRLEINDIYITYLNFGIEAARNLIYQQIDKIYNGSGNDINDAHILFLADIMTNTGTITSIDRHGINRLDTDPLSRSSFEKTVEHLLNASAFNEVDHMKSVSSRIMAGRCIKGGTGLCDILMDNEMFENSEYNNQEIININTGNRLEENGFMKDILIELELSVWKNSH